jgi:hypothetical protein
MFCKHKWKIIESYKFENELEKFRGARMDGFTARDLAKRGVITVLQCEKCTVTIHEKTVL